MTSSQRPPDAGLQSVQRTARHLDIKVRVNDSEKSRIQQAARAAALPVTAYLRARGLGASPATQNDRDLVQQVLLARGDVGRFGGLLKLWLTDPPKLDAFDRASVHQGVATSDVVCDMLLETTHKVLQRRSRRRRNTHMLRPSPTTGPRPPRLLRLRVPVTLAEKEAMVEFAKQSGLPTAEYLRRSARHAHPHSPIDGQALQALARCHARLNLLGRVIKYWLTDHPRLTTLPKRRAHGIVAGALAEALMRLQQLQTVAVRVHTTEP